MADPGHRAGSMPVGLLVLLLGGLAAETRGAGAEPGQEVADRRGRPNIVWISAEDLNPDLGCYGDREARTPNLDRLAAQGARFTRAFSVYGVCAPSRSAIITAMYPTAIGTMHMRSQAVPPPFVRCFPEYLRAAGYYCTNNAKTDYNFPCPVTAWDENGTQAHWRNRPEDRPFFSVFNLTVTHESQIRAEPSAFARQTRRLEAEERHDPAQVAIPPYYPDTPETRADWAHYKDLITALDGQVAELLRQLEEDGLAENTAVFFWGDHGRGLPRAKRWVYEASIHVPLLVRWPGRIEPGTVRDDLVSLIDLGPSVLSLAGVPIPAHMQGRAFLGDQAARPPRASVFAARDRMDEAYDIIRSVRGPKYHYIRNFQPEKPYAQYIDYMEEMPTMKVMRKQNKAGTLQGPQKLFFLPEKPVEELYDAESDPHEIHNLADRPEHSALLKQMRSALEGWIQETHDLGFLPEAELQERMRPGGRWARTLEPTIHPAGGTFEDPVSVRLSCPTEGASIAYTTEPGDRPPWKFYSGPFTLSRSETLRTKACRLGYRDSPIVEAKFQVGTAEGRRD